MLAPLLHLSGAPVQEALRMLDTAAARGVELLLPCDVVVARDWEDDEGCCTVELTRTCCSKERPCVPAGGGRS